MPRLGMGAQDLRIACGLSCMQILTSCLGFAARSGCRGSSCQASCPNQQHASRTHRRTDASSSRRCRTRWRPLQHMSALPASSSRPGHFHASVCFNARSRGPYKALVGKRCASGLARLSVLGDDTRQSGERASAQASFLVPPLPSTLAHDIRHSSFSSARE